MGVRQGLVNLAFVLPWLVAMPTVAFAQADAARPAAAAAPSSSSSGSQSPSAATGKASSSSSSAPANLCPPPTPDAESPKRLRVLAEPFAGKKFKIRLDKGGPSVGLPAPANEKPPAKNECFFVLAENQTDVVAELSFQRAQKNAKGVLVWAFTPIRRSESGKTTLNLNAVKAADVGKPGVVDGGASSDVLPGENPLILPAFVLIQNAQHQAANVRSGVALNIPVSGYGTSVELFVPRIKQMAWTNMFGLRVNFAKWSAAKFSFKKPVSNEIQDAEASGSNLQLDVHLRYPFSFKYFPRLGLFVSPLSNQTEILKVAAGSLSPQNTQTLTRSGLLVGAEAEVQPARHFFLTGRVTMSFKEAVTVKDESEPGEKISGTGTATRLHLTGIAGVRLPLLSSGRLVFEGMVGNSYRSDKYSEDVAYTGQEQQKDVATFFQLGLGYIL